MVQAVVLVHGAELLHHLLHIILEKSSTPVPVVRLSPATALLVTEQAVARNLWMLDLLVKNDRHKRIKRTNTSNQKENVHQLHE